METQRESRQTNLAKSYIEKELWRIMIANFLKVNDIKKKEKKEEKCKRRRKRRKLKIRKKATLI